MPIYAGKNLRYAHFAEICEKCSNMRICAVAHLGTRGTLDKYPSRALSHPSALSLPLTLLPLSIAQYPFTSFLFLPFLPLPISDTFLPLPSLPCPL